MCVVWLLILVSPVYLFYRIIRGVYVGLWRPIFEDVKKNEDYDEDYEDEDEEEEEDYTPPEVRRNLDKISEHILREYAHDIFHDIPTKDLPE